MIIHRWQAPQYPSEEQILMLLQQQGFDAQIENWKAGIMIKDHRHALTEILVVCQGELILNISGNQIVLRQGDKTEIPPNTKHAYQVKSTDGCRVVVCYHI